MKDGNIVAIGNGDKPEIIKDVEPAEIERLCEKHGGGMGDRVRRLHQRVDAIGKEVVPDPDLVGEYTQYTLKAAERDTLLSNDLAGRKIEDIDRRVDQYHRYLDVGSVLLFQHTGYGGSPRFLSVTLPNFKWICFNDTASSAVGWGANILFEHTWYRGRRLYLIGVVRFPNLKEFDFNDIASSYAGL